MGFCRIIVPILLLLPVICSLAEAQLGNRFMQIQFRGGSITALQVEPKGMSFIKELRPEFWQETAATRVEIEGNRAVISPLEVWHAQPLGVTGLTDEPVKLEPGHTLGQVVRIPEGYVFSSFSIRIPTWHSTESAATLSLYSGGRLLALRRLENVPDNSWQELQLDQPLGAGSYTIRLSEPAGSIGWWSSKVDAGSIGEALADGEPVDGGRSLQINARRLEGIGSLVYTLRDNKLELEARMEPEVETLSRTFPWRWKTTWTKEGYDCTAKAGVVFDRFFTDTQRYMPIQQLKRREHGGLSFDDCRWIEMDGTRDADLKLSGEKLHLHWEMSDREMSLRFDTPWHRRGSLRVTRWNLEVLPREDFIPEQFPRFTCSDPSLTEDLNRFWWERGFTYGAPPNRSIEFSEWMALVRSWFDGPQRQGELKHLLDYPMTDEGYVHTYGNSVGWPLVQGPQYDTRHFDTNARFILACWRHYLWTGDPGFLKKQAGRLRKAMRFQLEVLQGKDGLIITPPARTGKHKDLSNNYWDILPFGHLDAYANAVFYGSLTAMEQIEEALSRFSDTPPARNRGEAEKSSDGLSASEPTPQPPFGAGPGINRTDYAALRQKAHTRFDEIFWDEEKSRYVGCVDSDGMKHDYGFTFVNLEALYYGLGDKEKARRIYHWMETEPTSSGKPDTYSQWLFAPRATTIHNPMWRENAPAGERSNPSEPWWTFWWHGTPFGDQCQDGGAILYTSFFDLMDRLRYRGIEDAWQRFIEIMERYRMPDRLCGGSPLYRGETSQQEAAGSVGVDYPFPESALVPCFFLYGVLGIQAVPEGLRITPYLPGTLSWAEVKGIHWCGNEMRIRVTGNLIEIDFRDGKQQKYSIKPGESVLLQHGEDSER